MGVTDVRQRTAAPSAALLHEAAGRVSGAACFALAHGPVRTSRVGTGLLCLGRDFLERREFPQPREAGCPRTVAGLLGHVAHVALWAAVLTITAANGLRGWRQQGQRDIMISPTVDVHMGTDDLGKEEKKKQT